MKILAFALALTALVAGQASAAPIPASGLTGAFIASGGGAGSFSTVRALTAMIGDAAVQAEMATIQSRSTATARDQFVHVFDFAMSDAWARAGRDNVTVPDSSERGLVLAKALYAAGMQGGAFSSDAFFNALLTAKVWADVKYDIDAKYGPGSGTSFSDNVAALFTDLGSRLR